jgi:catechol 2,3-dioxygenase-like lactoylglutathione lyase family enzyme
MTIKLTTLYVVDQEQAVRFYTEVLGFVKKADFRTCRQRTGPAPGSPAERHLRQSHSGHAADALVGRTFSARSASRSSSRAGPIHVEHVGSADPPVAVHCLYGHCHRQLHRPGTGDGMPPPWVTYSPLLPLALLLLTGLYLFVLPYATKWRHGRRTV